MVVRSRILGLGVLAIGIAGVWSVTEWLRPYEPPGQSAKVSNMPGAFNVDLAIVGRGFRQVTDIQFVPGSSSRAVVLVKDGTARYVALSEQRVVTAEESPVVFQVKVRTDSELGLLGMAFHPKYADNGLFYVNYSPSGAR